MTEAPATHDARLEGVAYELVAHERASSLEEAAELRGLDPSAVIKTIVVRRGDDDYVFVLVPGDRVIDWPKLRQHLGERRLSMPGAEEALEATGYIRGTITPLAARHPWPVIADASLPETVSIGGGAPGKSLTLAGKDLARALDAGVADVTKLSQ